MGTRKMRERQEDLWYGGELPTAPGHPFYKRLNEILDDAKFDPFCETRCAGFYHRKLGRPSLPPGQYFRIMMIGFFEGLDSERGIAWRLADSLTLRQFLSIGLDERTPDHVTISRTRRLIDAETHQGVFSWVLERLAQAGLVKGKTIGVDSTTLEANAAMKSIVRRPRGKENVHKKFLIQAAACNLALLMRSAYGSGKPRAAHDAVVDAILTILAVMRAVEDHFSPWSETLTKRFEFFADQSAAVSFFCRPKKAGLDTGC